eukprot:358567-Chlamydomonas_euryale.AAC.1
MLHGPRCPSSSFPTTTLNSPSIPALFCPPQLRRRCGCTCPHCSWVWRMWKCGTAAQTPLQSVGAMRSRARRWSVGCCCRPATRPCWRRCGDAGTVRGAATCGQCVEAYNAKTYACMSSKFRSSQNLATAADAAYEKILPYIGDSLLTSQVEPASGACAKNRACASQNCCKASPCYTPPHTSHPADTAGVVQQLTQLVWSNSDAIEATATAQLMHLAWFNGDAVEAAAIAQALLQRSLSIERGVSASAANIAAAADAAVPCWAGVAAGLRHRGGGSGGRWGYAFVQDYGAAGGAASYSTYGGRGVLNGGCGALRVLRDAEGEELAAWPASKRLRLDVVAGVDAGVDATLPTLEHEVRSAEELLEWLAAQMRACGNAGVGVGVDVGVNAGVDVHRGAPSGGGSGEQVATAAADADEGGMRTEAATHNGWVSVRIAAAAAAEAEAGAGGGGGDTMCIDDDGDGGDRSGPMLQEASDGVVGVVGERHSAGAGDGAGGCVLRVVQQPAGSPQGTLPVVSVLSLPPPSPRHLQARQPDEQRSRSEPPEATGKENVDATAGGQPRAAVPASAAGQREKPAGGGGPGAGPGEAAAAAVGGSEGKDAGVRESSGGEGETGGREDSGGGGGVDVAAPRPVQRPRELIALERDMAATAAAAAAAAALATAAGVQSDAGRPPPPKPADVLRALFAELLTCFVEVPGGVAQHGPGGVAQHGPGGLCCARSGGGGGAGALPRSARGAVPSRPLQAAARRGPRGAVRCAAARRRARADAAAGDVCGRGGGAVGVVEVWR